MSYLEKISSNFMKWINHPDIPNTRLLKIQQVSATTLSPQQTQSLVNLIQNANLTPEQQEKIYNAIRLNKGDPTKLYSYISEMVRMFQQVDLQQSQLSQGREEKMKTITPADHEAIIEYIRTNGVFDASGKLSGPQNKISSPPAVVFQNFEYFTGLVNELAINEAAGERFILSVTQSKEEKTIPAIGQQSATKIPESLLSRLNQQEQDALVKNLSDEGVPFIIEDAIGKTKSLYPIYFISEQSSNFYNKFIEQEGLDQFIQKFGLNKYVPSAIRWLQQKKGVSATPEEIKGLIISRLATALSPYRRFNANTSEIVKFSDPRFEFFFRYPQYLPEDMKTQIGSTDASKAGQIARRDIMMPRKDELFAIIDQLISQGNEDIASFSLSSAYWRSLRDIGQDRLGAEQLEFTGEEGGRATERGDFEGGNASGYGDESESDKTQKAEALKAYLTNVFGEVRQIGEKVADYYRRTNQHTKADVVESIIDLSVDQLQKVIAPANEAMTKTLEQAGVVANYRSTDGKIRIGTEGETKLRGLVSPGLLLQQLDEIGRKKIQLKKQIDQYSQLGEPDNSIAGRLNISPQEVNSLKQQSQVAMEAELLTPDEKEMKQLMRDQGELMLEVLDFAEQHPEMNASQIAKQLGMRRGKHTGEGAVRAEKGAHPSLVFEARHIAELIEDTYDPSVLSAKRQDIHDKYIEQSDPEFNKQFSDKINTQRRRRVVQFLGDNFGQWAPEIAPMIPSTSEIARKIFLDLSQVHSAIKNANRPDFGWPSTNSYYQILGKEVPPEVQQRVQEYSALREKKGQKKRAEILFNIYKTASDKIEELKILKYNSIKTASIGTINNINNMIQDIVDMTIKRMKLYRK